MSQEIRLNKFIADAGIASRRKADQLIDEGLVKVNGKTVYELGRKIDPYEDSVRVGKKLIPRLKSRKYYLAFHKPREVVSSLKDPEDRPCIGDFFEKFPARIYPVGRLDWDSEGLILMTNDGDFSQEVNHPSKEIPKTYHVKIDGKIGRQKIQKLINGVSIPNGGRVRARKLKLLRSKCTKVHDWLEIEITEGKNRQIRKMFFKIGFDVLKLQRVAIGGLKLGSLKRGEFTELSPLQIEKIFTSQQKPRTKKKVSKKRNG